MLLYKGLIILGSIYHMKSVDMSKVINIDDNGFWHVASMWFGMSSLLAKTCSKVYLPVVNSIWYHNNRILMMTQHDNPSFSWSLNPWSWVMAHLNISVLFVMILNHNNKLLAFLTKLRCNILKLWWQAMRDGITFKSMVLADSNNFGNLGKQLRLWFASYDKRKPFMFWQLPLMKIFILNNAAYYCRIIWISPQWHRLKIKIWL